MAKHKRLASKGLGSGAGRGHHWPISTTGQHISNRVAKLQALSLRVRKRSAPPGQHFVNIVQVLMYTLLRESDVSRPVSGVARRLVLKLSLVSISVKV